MSAPEKHQIVLNTPHDVTEQRPQFVHEALAWLDQHMRRVGD